MIIFVHFVVVVVVIIFQEKPEQQEILILSNGETAEKTQIKPSKCTRVYHQFSKHAGILYMMFANILFSACTFALKFIPADMFDIMIVRFLIQSVVFGCYARFYKGYDVFNTNGQPIACILNILMSSGTNLLFLAGFYFLPLSDLNTIKYTYIVWTSILSVMILKERFKWINSVSLVLTLVGVFLAMKSTYIMDLLLKTNSNSSTVVEKSDGLFYLGVFFALTSSLTKAIQLIARKQLVAKKLPYSVMNFQFTSIAFFVSTAYSMIRRYWKPESYPWKWMCTAGVVIGCVQLLTNTLYAKALKRENVQLLSIIGTLEILYAVILQIIFLQQMKNSIFFVGALLVVISAIILTVDKSKSQNGK